MSLICEVLIGLTITTNFAIINKEGNRVWKVGRPPLQLCESITHYQSVYNYKSNFRLFLCNRGLSSPCNSVKVSCQLLFLQIFDCKNRKKWFKYISVDVILCWKTRWAACVKPAKVVCGCADKEKKRRGARSCSGWGLLTSAGMYLYMVAILLKCSPEPHLRRLSVLVNLREKNNLKEDLETRLHISNVLYNEQPLMSRAEVSLRLMVDFQAVFAHVGFLDVWWWWCNRRQLQDQDGDQRAQFSILKSFPRTHLSIFCSF